MDRVKIHQNPHIFLWLKGFRKLTLKMEQGILNIYQGIIWNYQGNWV